MKRQIKKWTLRLAGTGLLILGLLLVIVLNPVLTYAHQTEYKGYTIYHQKTFEPALTARLDEATQLVRSSEFYNPKLQLDICLNDGSRYPEIMRAVRGQAFAWGFYDKVVLQGKADCKDNFVEVNGYRWNLTQLLAHEITHCLQFNKLGLWKSNPIAKIPNWKWEGYAEYISRRNEDQKDLLKNITHFISTDKDSWAIGFPDGTIAPREYYEYWILVQYCMDIKKMSYEEVLADKPEEQLVREQMMNWYRKNNPRS